MWWIETFGMCPRRELVSMLCFCSAEHVCNVCRLFVMWWIETFGMCPRRELVSMLCFCSAEHVCNV